MKVGVTPHRIVYLLMSEDIIVKNDVVDTSSTIGVIRAAIFQPQVRIMPLVRYINIVVAMPV